MGLRIIERVREEYGGDADAHVVKEINPFANPGKANKSLQADVDRDGDVFSYSDGKEDIGGGFIANDDNDGPDGGGFLPKGQRVGRRAAKLTIENAVGPIDRHSLNALISVDLDIAKSGSPETEDNKGTPLEADLDTVTGPKKTGTIIDVPVFSSSRTGRTVPTRKATRMSKRAKKSHVFEHQTQEADKSN